MKSHFTKIPTSFFALGAVVILFSSPLRARAEEKTSANSSVGDYKLTRCLEALNKAKEVVTRSTKVAESKEQKAVGLDIKKDSSNGHDASKRAE